ncbi:uncharacterized protein LOC132869169 isoform X1 [Neoarius graeffei]|uniref:uncharacterized protein LOC132869169 isoform X1 n=1 Tax=Neoarius graeffei TaxID=443677 RepID=UPI00298D5450|nr:uncharacterized protein LOC132869169 isoform X1 [Neoarius graeffei]
MREKMQVIFGILLMSMGAALGLLFQDPVVCRFTETKQCYVALRQQLHLQMPLEERLDLQFKSETSGALRILTYRKRDSLPPKPLLPRWQFVKDNKTMILSHAERSDSGKYTLSTFDAKGTTKGEYNLQLIIEAEVTSVKVSDSCLFPAVRKVYCFASGDSLLFKWTSASATQLENGNRTLILEKTQNENVTCHVENHVSRAYSSIQLDDCPDLTLVILSVVCVLLIVLSVFTFYIFKKRHNLWNKEDQIAPSQDGKELVYSQVTHFPTNTTKTRPRTTQEAQDERVEYATVAACPSQRKQKKKEDEVQYGELVFNTPAQKKSKIPKVQEECVYSDVQHGQ